MPRCATKCVLHSVSHAVESPADGIASRWHSLTATTCSMSAYKRLRAAAHYLRRQEHRRRERRPRRLPPWPPSPSPCAWPSSWPRRSAPASKIDAYDVKQRRGWSPCAWPAPWPRCSAPAAEQRGYHTVSPQLGQRMQSIRAKHVCWCSARCSCCNYLGLHQIRH